METRRIIASVLFAVILLTPAFAAGATTNYSITVPASGNVYSGSYDLLGGRNFGVRHKYSGGKKVVMQMVRAADLLALGSQRTLTPEGASAPTTHLWYNSGSARDVRVRLNSAFGVVVTVLAQGTWVYNY